MMDEPISVSINNFATDEELEAIQEAFRLAGIDTKVEATYFMKSADPVPWIVTITLASATGAFLSGFFGKLGADAADGMQEWVRRIWKAWESSPALPGRIEIHGKDGTTVDIRNPPEEAYNALLELDWEDIECGWLFWDSDAGEWQHQRSM